MANGGWAAELLLFCKDQDDWNMFFFFFFVVVVVVVVAAAFRNLTNFYVLCPTQNDA